MGSYAYLRIGDLTLTSSKREPDPTVLILFTESDRVDRPFTNAEIIRAFDCGDDPEGFVQDELDGDWPVAVEYVASLRAVRDRLEFMGFTMRRVRDVFEAGVQERLEELANHKVDPRWAANDLVKAIADEEAVLAQLTLDNWLEAFTYIIGARLRPLSKFSVEAKEASAKHPPLVHFLITESFGEGVWFPAYDFRALMRAAVEITGTDAEVVYNVSEILEPDELDDLDLCGWARRELVDEFVINHKIIVLGEGSTDTRSIELALRILRPHLAEYYSFMDFQSTRAPGGAAALVATIKAFVGAGIVNRIVALFDNDTAARTALRALREVELPETVKVLHYPNAPWAMEYPTLGPTGVAIMDVNGLAGSLELYFGESVLRQDDGNLTPVQWRGYDEVLGQYQGEVMHKAELQRRFNEMSAICLNEPDAVLRYDWSGMELVLQTLCTAFH